MFVAAWRDGGWCTEYMLHIHSRIGRPIEKQLNLRVKKVMHVHVPVVPSLSVSWHGDGPSHNQT